MELVLASRNRKKARELASILEGLPVTVRAVDEFPGVPDVEEDGETFLENAVKKARAVARVTGRVALADDSGLEVDALDGAPGVRSARFAGEDAGDEANNLRLLSALKTVPEAKRTARFRCVVALADPGGEVETAEGSCEGVILDSPRGEGGFGYDPIFLHLPSGKTFAELTPGEKHRVSHRGRALAAASGIIARWVRERGG